MGKKLISARIGVLRSDWNPDQFGSEVSFWSRDEDQIFQYKGEVAQDGALESMCFNVALEGLSVTIQALDATGSQMIGSYACPEDDESEQWGGARTFIAQRISEFVDSESLADDLAFLILNNGKEVMSDDDWKDVVDCNWFGSVGQGDQLIVESDEYAGAVFLDVVTSNDVDIMVDDGAFEIDFDQASENRSEETRFVGVGVE